MKKSESTKALLNAFKKIALKDYFDEQDGKELLVALQEMIASFEQSEELVTTEQLKDAIDAFFVEKLKEGAEVPEPVANAIRKAVRDIQPSVRTSSYLDTKDAVKDFRDSIIKSRNAEEFRANWSAHLTRNAISGIAYPTEVSKGIATAWSQSTGLFSRLTKVASKGFKLMYTTATDENTVAHGHVTKGSAKAEQAFTVLTKDLSLEMVYKWIPVDRIDLASLEDDAAFVNWIVTELSDRLQETIERVIISGDPNTTAGRLITSLESIGAKAASDFWTTYIQGTTGTISRSIYEGVLATEGRNKWVYVAKDALGELLNISYETVSGSSNLYLTLNQLEQQWGVERIIPYDFPRANAGTITSGEIIATVLSPEDYYRIGGEPFGEQWSIYEKNQEAFMAEIAIGGGVGKAKASAVVKLS